MQKSHKIRVIQSFFIFIFLCYWPLGALASSLDIQKKLQNDIEKITAWTKQDSVISAVKEQNSQNIPLTKIKEDDQEWRQTLSSLSQSTELMQKQLLSPLAEWFRQQNIKNQGRYPEIFLTDNQGANVAVSKLTSDYWQGDEDKWKKSFAGGKGAIYIGKPEYDSSTQTMQVQVSVPVIDNNKAIGVLVVGVKYSEIK